MELPGRSHGGDAGCPRGKAEGQRSGSALGALTSILSLLQGSCWPSKESEQSISTSTLIFYLSSYKAPKSGSPESQHPESPKVWPDAWSTEHPAPLHIVEHLVTMAMRNLLLLPVTLVMAHRLGSITAPAHLGHTCQGNMALLLGTIWTGCSRGNKAEDIPVEETW